MLVLKIIKSMAHCSPPPKKTHLPCFFVSYIMSPAYHQIPNINYNAKIRTLAFCFRYNTDTLPLPLPCIMARPSPNVVAWGGLGMSIVFDPLAHDMGLLSLMAYKRLYSSSAVDGSCNEATCTFKKAGLRPSSIYHVFFLPFGHGATGASEARGYLNFTTLE